jgi:hypothetical protein
MRMILPKKQPDMPRKLYAPRTTLAAIARFARDEGYIRLKPRVHGSKTAGASVPRCGNPLLVGAMTDTNFCRSCQPGEYPMFIGGQSVDLTHNSIVHGKSIQAFS